MEIPDRYNTIRKMGYYIKWNAQRKETTVFPESDRQEEATAPLEQKQITNWRQKSRVFTQFLLHEIRSLYETMKIEHATLDSSGVTWILIPVKNDPCGIMKKWNMVASSKKNKARNKTWKSEICLLPWSITKPETRHEKVKYVCFLEA